LRALAATVDGYKGVEGDKDSAPVWQMRDSTGAPNLNLNTIEIITRYIEVELENRKIPVWIYYPRRQIGQKDRPACIFLHGGS